MHEIRDGQEDEVRNCPDGREKERDALRKLEEGPARDVKHGEDGGERSLHGLGHGELVVVEDSMRPATSTWQPPLPIGPCFAVLQGAASESGGGAVLVATLSR